MGERSETSSCRRRGRLHEIRTDASEDSIALLGWKRVLGEYFRRIQAGILNNVHFESHLHRTLDRGAADFAFALERVTVRGGQEGAIVEYWHDQCRARAQVSDVYVSGRIGRGDRCIVAILCRRNTDASDHRMEVESSSVGHLHVSLVEIPPDLDQRILNLVPEEAELRQQCSPTPTQRLEIQDFDLESIARLC